MVRFLYFLLLIAPLCLMSAQETEAPKQVTIDTPKLSQEYFKKLIDSSNIYYDEGNYKKSLEVNILLLKLALAENEPYYIHSGYRHLGYDYMAMNDTLLAEESFEKSEKFAKLAKNDTATALTYMDLANLNSTLKSDHKKALEYHDHSIELFGKIKDSAGLAKAHYNAIMTALEAKEMNKAFLHLIKAKKLVKFDPHSSYMIGLNNLFGDYYLKKENYEMANLYFQKVIPKALEDNLPIDLEYALVGYSESLSKQGKFEEAYNTRLEYEKYYEENLRNLTSSEVEALSAKFQVGEYRKDVLEAEMENQLQTEIAKNRGQLNTILLIVCACFIIMFVILFTVLRKRKLLVSQLKIKNKEYLKAKEQSENLSKAKGKFFSTVSHELRTPLYGVIGLSTILLEDESLKSHEKDLKSLKFSADYLLALINDVLQINKIDSEKIEDDKTSFNMRELLETIVSSFEYMRIQNNNTIYIDVADDVPHFIYGNPVRLSQILMNLVGNAMKFTENGEICVTARSIEVKDKRFTIEFLVKDNGIGIAKEKQESIFDEFSQGDSINYNYQGTGLGLPIVKKLLMLSNSDISVESALGKGSTFRFSLTYEAAEKSVSKEQQVLMDIKSLQGKRILIAEDNRINQIVTQKILEKNEIVCAIAENGLQAVESVRRDHFDLVLMDINMPIKSGIEATKEIREFNKTIPILALTAVEIEEMRYKIYDCGMNDIIVKPYDVTKFEQTLLKNLSKVEDKSHLEAI